MKNFSLILFCIFMALSSSMSGQKLDKKGCGTHGTTPWFEYYMEHRDEFPTDYPEMVEYVPITIHILGSDEGIGYFPLTSLFPAFCQLNEDFAPMNIQFYIKDEINYINNTSWYLHPEFSAGFQMMNVNNVRGTVNCYFVADPAGTCGYFSPGADGVALSKSCNGPNDHTWAHELGHFFSLPHTFVGWEGTDYDGFIPGGNRRGVENVARTNCRTTADRFCDTPADYLSFRWSCNNQGKSSIVQTDRNGVQFQSDGTLFMSYANDACMTRFSDEQMDAVNANLRTDRRNLRSTPQVLEAPSEAVIPVEPESGGVVQFDEGRLTWNQIEHATGYHVLMSRIPNLSAGFIVNETVKDTFIDLPELLLGLRYYWRVIPFNEFHTCYESEDRFSFTTAATTSNTDVNSRQLFVYPIPLPQGSTLLNVDGLDAQQTYQWEVYDIHGRQIALGITSDDQINLNSDLKSGIYSLMMYNQKEVFSTQIVVD